MTLMLDKQKVHKIQYVCQTLQPS